MDVLEDIQTFASEGYGIVFYSYQWLSWTHKGPNGVQREWMNSAVRHYSARSGIPADKISVWLDILSIPQSNREVQKLAVDSLDGTRELAAVAASGERGACCERPAAMEPRSSLEL